MTKLNIGDDVTFPLRVSGEIKKVIQDGKLFIVERNGKEYVFKREEITPI